MSQHYSDAEREDDPYTLPDVEIFYHDSADNEPSTVWELEDEPGEYLPKGYYYWYCFPGCLPDSEPNGPFETEEDAKNAVREENKQ